VHLGLGVLVVKEETGWVLRQDGSREDIDAMSVVTWDTGDWVEYGSDGGFKTDGYRAKVREAAMVSATARAAETDTP
jgi:hypothetical protein